MFARFAIVLCLVAVGCSPSGSSQLSIDQPATVPAEFSPAERQRLDCCRWIPVDDAWQPSELEAAFWQFDLDPTQSSIRGHDGCGEFAAVDFGRFAFDDGGAITTNGLPADRDDSCPTGITPIPLPSRGDVVWASGDMSRLVVVGDDDAVQVRFISELRYPEIYGQGRAPDSDDLIEELAVARQRWGAVGPSDYKLEGFPQCDGCLVEGQSSTTTVRNGRTDSTVKGIGGAVEEIFEFVADGLAIGLISDAGFDPVDGHPTFFTLTTDYVVSEIDMTIPPTDFEFVLTPG